MKTINRIVIYICGIFLIALGGVLTIKSNLGASPISSLPLSISKISRISLGTAAAMLFTIYVVIQILILKKDFKKIQLLQIVFAILFGKIMNFFNVIITIDINNFYSRLFICILSFFITALGVVFTISTNIVPVAPDGLAQVISKKARIDFGKAKIYFDCSIVILSVSILLINNRELDGIGIGTILSALLVGRIVAYINKNLNHKIEHICFDKTT